MPSYFVSTHYGGTPFTTPTYGASFAGSTVTVASNNGRLDRADRCTFTTTGTLPSPVSPSTLYGVQSQNSPPLSSTTFQIYDLNTSATIGPFSGGSGTHTVEYSVSERGIGSLAGRTVDTAANNWDTINTADGVYDWSGLDRYIPYHYGLGRQIIYTLFKTPSWLGATVATPPTTMAKVGTFVNALLTRYNTVSAVNPTGAKMIAAIEAWNEPAFTNANWSGTAAQMVEVQRQVRLARDAVDATCKVLSPGFTSGMGFYAKQGDTGLYAFLTASDGVGGVGKDHIDGVAIHGYAVNSMYRTVLLGQTANLRTVLVAAGLSADFPLWMTEATLYVPAVYSEARFALEQQRTYAIYAGLGFQTYTQYRHDSPAPDGTDAQFPLSYAPRTSPTLVAAMNEVHTALGGKTLTYCAVNQDGSVTVIANGVTYTW